MRTARDAAEALVSAFGMNFGEVVIRVSEGQIRIIRAGHEYQRKALESLKLRAP